MYYYTLYNCLKKNQKKKKQDIQQFDGTATLGDFGSKSVAQTHDSQAYYTKSRETYKNVL
jgi:hypothetical protein